ncbi:methyltransferase family protein [Candidatus Methanoperedens nitroreducens]|uniref:Methyltransferase family protein n=1 Tax=Candidatus Methanoperedens nitratireducens TaxID=1392998 RepID=A0A062V5X3_9EURY|nr:class I SAM-dependent methyltransferase [Candidatus Methanoperedens nitroreducens]KCZ71958.1 methyltransferase family protein [Candidatus Methanoperedens nitroreducens]MDJ1422065.1 class I SAM-dependent methyltransferase [Candidatus Methanoperedens sp.]
MRCSVCDLIFVPDRYHLLPGDEIARYRLHDNTLLNEGYVRMFLEKISLIRQYCPGVNSALDYGCGPEPVLAELMKRDGFYCDVYDPYFYPVVPGGSYDLVISTEVFEHLRDIREELYNIRSLLNPGGFLAVMTSFHDTIRDFGGWWYISDPTHICFFSMRTFDWISEQFGFRIIHTDRKNFIILQMELQNIYQDCK